MNFHDITYKKINYDDTKDIILNYHYAHRMPNIKYAYGLYHNDKLKGVITYGIPASPSLCKGVLGEAYKDHVVELNRLYINDEISQVYKNITSNFLAYTLKQLKPYNLCIVSFADSCMNHIGGIYQATNFLFTGKTKERTDIFSGFDKHSRHYNKEEEQLLRVVRSSKYRYIYFACDKKHRKKYLNLLKYPILPYPKDLKNQHYKKGDKTKVKYRIEETKEIVTEEEAKKYWNKIKGENK